MFDTLFIQQKSFEEMLCKNGGHAVLLRKLSALFWAKAVLRNVSCQYDSDDKLITKKRHRQVILLWFFKTKFNCYKFQHQNASILLDGQVLSAVGIC